LQAFVNAFVGNPDCSQPGNEVGPEMLELIRRIKRCEQGATAVEYGLIAAMIVIAMMAALRSTADANSNMWNFVSNEIVGASESV
jgi:pilus assembly protein Flp/PilA